MKFLFCLFLIVGVTSMPSPSVMAKSLTLEQRIGLAAAYLEKCVKDSGRFVYKRDLNGNETVSAQYNFLRHAGTLYAMALSENSSPHLLQREKIKKAADYLIDCCLEPVDGQPDLLAVWSHPTLRGRPQAPLQAKLGGTGLALAALIQAREVLPGIIEIDRLRKMGNFLLFMQNNDGSFVSKYYPDRDPPKDTTWESLYYPGEAALGLVMLYEIDNDLRWLEAAIDALRYLSRKRENQQSVEADHWALMATERLFRQEPATLQSGAPGTIPWSAAPGKISIKENLRRHGERIVDSILAEQIQETSNLCLYGGFSMDGRITPTATRLEGLLAAHAILPPGERRANVADSIRLGFDFLVRNQITEGINTGGFARYSLSCSHTDRSRNAIRIDYVQHSLAAFIGYQEFTRTLDSK